MKRALLIAASIALGTASIAQAQPAATPAGPESQNAPTATTQGAATNSMPSSDPSATTPPSGGASMPAPSDSAAPPPAPADAGSAPAAGSADTSSYPKCGKGVTDKCVQAGGMGGKKHMMHKRMMHKAAKK